MGNLEGAIADYTRAIEVKPSLAEAYNDRGHVRSTKSGLDGALADFDRAIKINPVSPKPTTIGAASVLSKAICKAPTSMGR
jgi:tetratricopeptide (TPR) repeat protein